MSCHYADLLRWTIKPWDAAHAELEADFNEAEITETFTTNHFEFEYDAVIDRAQRYARESGISATEESSEDADLCFNRYVTPSRTIMVIAPDRPGRPEIAGVLHHTLVNVPIRYRFAIDAEDALGIIYPDGTAVGAYESRAGKKWLKSIGCNP